MNRFIVYEPTVHGGKQSDIQLRSKRKHQRLLLKDFLQSKRGSSLEPLRFHFSPFLRKKSSGIPTGKSSPWHTAILRGSLYLGSSISIDHRGHLGYRGLVSAFPIKQDTYPDDQHAKRRNSSIFCSKQKRNRSHKIARNKLWTRVSSFDIVSHVSCGRSSVGEHCFHTAGVGGPIPPARIGQALYLRVQGPFLGEIPIYSRWHLPYIP